MTDYTSQFASAMAGWGQPTGAPGFSSLGTAYAPGSGDVTGFMSNNSPLLSKQMLDGTNSFGANSMPGGYGVGQDTGSPSNGGGGGIGFFSTPGQQGWGGMALDGASSLAKAFMGMKQYGLAKQQLAENQRQFDTNFGAQKKLTNSNLEDRQLARVASNPGAYESVGSYMNKNGVK